ncbi:MAG: hypothetical protein NT154_47795 [Verrucomicrobia bacterium]|nr:hypothetical protein [Verrucomicrobiota bacterium]
MSNSPTIHVTGDTHTAVFYVPPGRIFFDGVNSKEAYAHAMPVGVEYIFRAIRAACNPDALLSPVDVTDPVDVALSRAPGTAPFVSRSDRVARYEIANVGDITDLRGSTKLPLLRCANADAQAMNVLALPFQHADIRHDPRPDKVDVLVNWFGEMAGYAKSRLPHPSSPTQPVECQFHIQIGLASPLGTEVPKKTKSIAAEPGRIAKPKLARLSAAAPMGDKLGV